MSTSPLGDKSAWENEIPSFSKLDNPNQLTRESSFSILFPIYREEYMKTCWPTVVEILSKHGIVAELDLRQGSMLVKTTRKTWDPYIIIKARDMLKLLSRSVPVEQAKTVLDDGIGSEIIDLALFVKSRDSLIKRRRRLLGPKACTLQSLQLLTNTFMKVQGQTVSIVGPYKHLNQAIQIVKDTMKNIHPIHNIKTLMIKRELAKNTVLKQEDWAKFLPNFKLAKSRMKKHVQVVKKEYNPFPPPPVESKMDKMLASGEYFLHPEDSETVKANSIAAKRKIRDERGPRKYLEKVLANVAPDEDSKELESLKDKIYNKI